MYETDSACIQYGTSINSRAPSVYLSIANSANIGEDAEAQRHLALVLGSTHLIAGGTSSDPNIYRL